MNFVGMTKKVENVNVENSNIDIIEKVVESKKSINMPYYMEELELNLLRSTNVIFSNKMLVDREALDIVQEMRRAFPSELADAREIVKYMQEIIARAQEKSEDIVEKAENMAKNILDESRLIKEAQERADIIIKNAMEADAKIRKESQNYIKELFSVTESGLADVVNQFKNAQKYYLEAHQDN